MKLKDIKLVKGDKTKPYEYLCNNCGQLRLAFIIVDECQNCFSSNIVKGAIGTLEKKEPKLCICCEEITEENAHLHKNCGK